VIVLDTNVLTELMRSQPDAAIFAQVANRLHRLQKPVRGQIGADPAHRFAEHRFV
jgi:predicted nucleic acid-binding protein